MFLQTLLETTRLWLLSKLWSFVTSRGELKLFNQPALTKSAADRKLKSENLFQSQYCHKLCVTSPCHYTFLILTFQLCIDHLSIPGATGDVEE